jgi:hypothetical protein
MATFDFYQVAMMARIWAAIRDIKSIIDAYQSLLEFLAARLDTDSKKTTFVTQTSRRTVCPTPLPKIMSML